MNKVMIAMVVALVATGMLVAATVTNRLGQVITTTVGADGVTTTIVVANGAATATNRTVLPCGSQLDLSVTTTTTAFTPRNYGDLLIGKAGVGTNKVWIATGLTTSDWTLLN